MIGKGLKKIDSSALIKGKPVYTEDLITDLNTLTIKIMRSPYAHAKILNIDNKYYCSLNDV